MKKNIEPKTNLHDNLLNTLAYDARSCGLKQFMMAIEKYIILEILNINFGIKSRAAKDLKIHRSTLVEKIRRFCPEKINKPIEDIKNDK